MATPRILVVDDDEQMRFVLGESLTRRQYEVMLVVSAEEALTALAHGAFDLILLDVRLPKMSGIDALDEILRVDHRAPVGRLGFQQRRLGGHLNHLGLRPQLQGNV